MIRFASTAPSGSPAKWTERIVRSPGLTVAAMLFSTMFLLYHYKYPSAILRADAWGYAFLAFGFRLYGFMNDLGSIRTYLYPAYLTVLSYMSGYSYIKLSLIAGIIQCALYISAVSVLARQYIDRDTNLALAIASSLLFNPFLVALTTDILTEGLTTSLSIILFICVIHYSSEPQVVRKFTCISAASLIASALLMTRPGNVPLFLAWHITFSSDCIYRAMIKRGRTIQLFLMYVVNIVAALLPLAPQVIYNMVNYHKFTVFPLCDLSHFQASFGVALWKYDTSVTGEVASPYNYLNPLYDGGLASFGAWSWYRSHPLRFLATSSAHLFASFDVVTPFVYVRSFEPWYSMPMRLLSWFGFVFGIYRICIIMYQSLKEKNRLYKDILVIIFLAVVIATTLLINSISAVETRFNIVPIMMISVYAVDFALAILSHSKSVNFIESLALAVVVACLVFASCEFDRLGTSDPLPSDLATLAVPPKCFISNRQDRESLSDIVQSQEILMRDRAQ